LKRAPRQLSRRVCFWRTPQLVPPGELRAAREELLARLGQGETALQDETLLLDFESWRAEYGRIYSFWHAAQNDAARWNSLRRLANSDALRALERLSSLQNRKFPFASEIVATLREETAKHCPREWRNRARSCVRFVPFASWRTRCAK
jgi:hypothetical protein